MSLVITRPSGLFSLTVLAIQSASCSFSHLFQVIFFPSFSANYKVTVSFPSLGAASGSHQLLQHSARRLYSCSRWNTKKKEKKILDFPFFCGWDKTVTLINHLSQCPWTGGSVDKSEFQGSRGGLRDTGRVCVVGLYSVCLCLCSLLRRLGSTSLEVGRQRQVDCPDFTVQRRFCWQHFCFAPDNGVIVPREEVSP